MNSRELEYVLTIASEKNISVAADKLFISQPALSLFLKRLELSLNLQLFDRTENGMVLTYAGERYVQMAKKVLADYAEFESDLLNVNSLQKARLRVGTSPHIGSLALPKILPSYYEKYPNIKVSLKEEASGTLERLLMENELDLALMHMPFKDLTPVAYEEIMKDRYVMVFSMDNPLRQFLYEHPGEHFPYIDPSHAKNEKFILAFQNQRVRQITNRILSFAEIFEPNIILETSSVQTAVRFAAAGMGVTFMPESYIQLFNIPKSTIFCYLEPEFHAFWIFAMVYSESGLHSLPAKLFIEMAKQIFGK